MRTTFILFIRYLLPFHKRLTNRLIWIRIWAAKFDEMMNFIDSYRTAIRKELSVTIQTMAFQSHLNDLFDGTLRRILITHYEDNSLSIGLESEGVQYCAKVGLEGETPDTFIYAALEGESTIPLGVDYKVLYPSGVNQNALITELDKYRPAGKLYSLESF